MSASRTLRAIDSTPEVTPVITQGVELPMARACARRKRQGHAQAPQPELNHNLADT